MLIRFAIFQFCEFLEKVKLPISECYNVLHLFSPSFLSYPFISFSLSSLLLPILIYFPHSVITCIEAVVRQYRHLIWLFWQNDMGFKASFNAFIYSINTPPPSPDPAKTSKPRKCHTKTTTSDSSQRQHGQIFEIIPSQTTQRSERQAARDRNRSGPGAEAEFVELQHSSQQVVSFEDPTSGPRRPDRESRRHRSRAYGNRPRAGERASGRPTREASETLEHHRNLERREARRERARRRTGERLQERDGRERTRERDSRERAQERGNDRTRERNNRDRSSRDRPRERTARREERTVPRRNRDHTGRRRNQINPAFPPPINIQEATSIRIRRPVPLMPLPPQEPDQSPISSLSTPSTLPEDSSDEVPEYDVNDIEIPPYRASLHKYLDLMSFDPRFVPCLRINRSLVRNHDKLQESIHEFKRFNKLPNSVDLWKINHVDDAHFDDILPDLIPYPLPPRQRHETNHESELQPHELQAINDYDYALFLEQQEQAMAHQYVRA